MRIIRRSQIQAIERDYGKLELLTGRSRQNPRSKNADLKKVSINPNQTTSHHFHLERESIFYVESGKVELISYNADTREILNPGDIVVIDQGEDHVFRNVDLHDVIMIEVESPPHSQNDKHLYSDPFKKISRNLGSFWENSSNIKLKICGIRTIDSAHFCSQIGVDAIGIHAVGHDWKKVVEISQWIQIAADGMSVFLLTDIRDVRLVSLILNKLFCDTIQIQGQMSIEDLIKLAIPLRNQGYKIVKSIEVPRRQEDIRNYTKYIQKLQTLTDAIILDSDWKGGTGKSPNWSIVASMVKHIQIPVILAGGITDKKINHIMQHISPYGIDVESGVERILGDKNNRLTVKDPFKIERLRKKVKEIQK